MTEFEGVTYASCGTSCDDLVRPPVDRGEGKQARIPKGLFRNCREVMDLLQDEEETNSLVELKEEEEEMPLKGRKAKEEPPLIEEFTLDRAMQLPSLRETQDPDADDLFEKTFFARPAESPPKRVEDAPLSVSSRDEDAKTKENEILKKKMEEVKARVHGSKKAHSSFSAQIKTQGAQKTGTVSSEKEEEFENDEELKKTLEEVKRIAEESKREHETLFSKIRTMRGGKLEPQDRSFLLMGGEEKNDKEEEEEEEKNEKGKPGKMLIEELD